jgi:hypothetical protein
MSEPTLEVGEPALRLGPMAEPAQFRAGQWCDGYLYSRLRDDPSPR